ncbi:terpene synthase [Solwaraspora sp. WMMD937]|uniref:terpene synthase family protein n=1 Tax=Solwaraspora sp. WMMD937 TaxID=3016090 RepID=UPI00249A993F|nr:terpene synthase [Solwaraspora sp. WMMD937]WFE22990.1 terpene synthase [Solwaraspora sp. WMMD937]
MDSRKFTPSPHRRDIPYGSAYLDGPAAELLGELLVELRAACPLPTVLSPYAAQADAWLPGWLQRCGLPPGTATHRRLAGARIGRYAARLYPGAPIGRLRVVAAMFAWFFLLDDEFDGVADPQEGRLRQLADEVLAVLRSDPAPGSHPVMAGPLRRMLAGPWQTVRQSMPDWWHRRFVEAVAEHLDGAVREAANKAAGYRPGPDEYVELRRATSAAHVAYTLIEYATGDPVPDAVFHHPRVRDVLVAGNDLLSWYNDFFSLPRDLTTAGGHNLVVAVAETRRVPIGDALVIVAHRWRAEMAAFGARQAEVPSFGPDHDRAARGLLAGVGYAVRGTIDWSFESARYQQRR